MVFDLVVDTAADGTVTVYDDANPSHSASARCGVLCLSADKTGGCHPGSIGTDASLTVSCGGDDSYTLDTGNDEGECTTELNQQGTATGANCDDGEGNTATATCAAGCTGSSGSGSCDDND